MKTLFVIRREQLETMKHHDLLDCLRYDGARPVLSNSTHWVFETESTPAPTPARWHRFSVVIAFTARDRMQVVDWLAKQAAA